MEANFRDYNIPREQRKTPFRLSGDYDPNHSQYERMTDDQVLDLLQRIGAELKARNRLEKSRQVREEQKQQSAVVSEADQEQKQMIEKEFMASCWQLCQLGCSNDALCEMDQCAKLCQFEEAKEFEALGDGVSEKDLEFENLATFPHSAQPTIPSAQFDELGNTFQESQLGEQIQDKSFVGQNNFKYSNTILAPLLGGLILILCLCFTVVLIIASPSSAEKHQTQLQKEAKRKKQNRQIAANSWPVEIEPQNGPPIGSSMNLSREMRQISGQSASGEFFENLVYQRFE